MFNNGDSDTEYLNERNLDERLSTHSASESLRLNGAWFKAMTSIPRPEHPRPDFVRPLWMNLNGVWEFAFDEKDEGARDDWQRVGYELPLHINVPFCFQSELSGVNDKRLCEVIWYKRQFSLPREMQNKRILLHFGAVDFACQVFINGIFAGGHRGGYTPFCLDITNLITDGENLVAVRCEDRNDCTQPRGKQYWKEGWIGCWYTPVSGIWQTVYIEATGDKHLTTAHVKPDIDSGMAYAQLTLDRKPDKALTAELTVSLGGRVVRRVQTDINERYTQIGLNMIEGDRIEGFSLWSHKDPALYDLEIKLVEASEAIDEVKTYFGMRKIEVKDGWVLLNNQPLYQRLILDQGYWPESLITPPSDEAIRSDIEWTQKFGYNGARKHQKLEDPRYYYWADKMGLLVWGEVPSAYEYTSETVTNLFDTLEGFIERDFNHPCIITWVPLNESWGVTRIYADKRMQNTARMLYHACKALDGTRLVSVNDGWEQVETDIFALHDYAAEGSILAKHFASRDNVERHSNDWRMATCDTFRPTGKEAFMVTEYGGIAFEENDENTWGYHDKVRGEEAFFVRYKGQTDAVRALDYCQGYCYTQLTDVQQEINGLLTPDRKPKIDVERYRALTANPDGRYN